MKILILAVDALEYNRVQEWNLKVLKQKEYGKVSLPLEESNEGSFTYTTYPITVTMWTSFITGKWPKEHKVSRGKIYRNPILRFMASRMSVRTERALTALGVGKILKIFRFKQDYATKEILKFKTIFDFAKNPKVISVPGYNEDKRISEIKRVMIYALGKNKKYPKKKPEKMVFEVFESKRKRLFESLNENHDMVMIHFYILDIIQHLYFKDKNIIKKYYDIICKMIKDIKKVLKSKGEDTLILIVSDHGNENGLHTKHAFYSVNKKLRLKNPNLVDFFDIIKQIMIK